MANEFLDFIKTQIPFMMIMLRDGININMLMMVIGIPLLIIISSKLSTICKYC